MEGLDKLPLPVLVAIGFGLAIILAVRYLGLLSGEKASAAPAAAQVAAVIVDPTAINKMTEQTSRMVDVLRELVDEVREGIRTYQALTEEIDKLREELHIQWEIERRLGPATRG